MTVNEVESKIEELKVAGLALSQHSILAEENYGIDVKSLKDIAKTTCDPILADELYATKNHDLKVFATLIDDPASYTLDELQQRSEQLYPSPFAEQFCQKVMARSPHAVHYIDKWVHEVDSEHRAYAFLTLAEIAKSKNKLSPDFFKTYIEKIAVQVDGESEMVQEAMHEALMAMAQRSVALKKEVNALHIANRDDQALKSGTKGIAEKTAQNHH